MVAKGNRAKAPTSGRQGVSLLIIDARALFRFLFEESASRFLPVVALRVRFPRGGRLLELSSDTSCKGKKIRSVTRGKRTKISFTRGIKLESAHNPLSCLCFCTVLL